MAIARSTRLRVSRPWFTSQFKRQMPFTRPLFAILRFCCFTLYSTTNPRYEYSSTVTHITCKQEEKKTRWKHLPFNLSGRDLWSQEKRSARTTLLAATIVIICNFAHLLLLRHRFIHGGVISGPGSVLLCFCNELSNFLLSCTYQWNRRRWKCGWWTF